VASPIAAPSRHSESGRREFVAAVGVDKAGGKGRIDFKTGADVRASFYLAQKFIDRARAEFMKRSGEATETETEIGGRIIH
jgi:hypothetical protein